MQGTLAQQGLSLNGNLVYIGNGQDALFQDDIEEEIEFSIETDKEIRASWTWLYIKDADLLPLKNKNITEYDDLLDLPLFSDRFHYLSAERLGPRSSFGTSNHEVFQHHQIGVKGEFAAHYLSLFGKEPVREELLGYLDASGYDLNSQVNAWMSTLSPGTRVSAIELDEVDLVNLRYQFVGERAVSSNPFRPTNVGFGLTNVLPILVAVLSSQVDTFIIIENPEAHLHPKGQFQMGRLLSIAAASGIQLLVETHSDHVLNGIRLSVGNGIIKPSQVGFNFFERDPNNHILRRVITPNIDNKGRIDFWPDGFFDEWEKSLDALLEL